MKAYITGSLVAIATLAGICLMFGQSQATANQQIKEDTSCHQSGQRMEKCRPCSGTGQWGGKTCPWCNGRGYTWK